MINAKNTKKLLTTMLGAILSTVLVTTSSAALAETQAKTADKVKIEAGKKHKKNVKKAVRKERRQINEDRKDVIAEVAEDKFNGLKGLTDGPYKFEISGVLKLDQRQFMGSRQAKGREFFSGGNLRDLGVEFSGTTGEYLSYVLGFSYGARNSSVDIEEAFLTYSGLGDQFDVSVGRVDPGFSLESTSSSKWIPLLERSMPSVAFGTDPGLGVSLSKWQDNYSITMALTQPKPNNRVNMVNTGNTEELRSDRWNLSARVTRNLIQEDFNRILQVGISGYVQDDSHAAVRFKTDPEARARNMTTLLDTGLLTAKRHNAAALEMAWLDGPMYAEAEYKTLYVKRDRDVNYPNAESSNRFHGYHVQAAYVLTGESRTYKPKLGVFGQVKPASKGRGAWEVAARYSFINLNDKDVRGGRGNNLGFGLNYYVNNNIGIFGEYTLAKLHPNAVVRPITSLANTDKRTLHIFGLRLQLTF